MFDSFSVWLVVDMVCVFVLFCVCSSVIVLSWFFMFFSVSRNCLWKVMVLVFIWVWVVLIMVFWWLLLKIGKVFNRLMF